MKPKGTQSFFKNVSLTAGAEILDLVSGFAVVALLGWWRGPVLLAEYLLLRRVSQWLLAGSRLGIATALPRYVAQCTGANSGSQKASAYFVGGAGIVMAISALVAAVLVAARWRFAAWLFGHANRGELILALALMLVGWAAHTVIYCYYVGVLEMVRANIMTVCNLAIVPVGIVVVLGRTHSIAYIGSMMGVWTLMCSVLFSIPIWRRVKAYPLLNLAEHARELLRYGIPRVPGDFANYALLAVGPVIAAHYVSMARLSSLLLGMTVLALVSYCSSPIRTVLLSQMSMMLERGGVESVRGKLETLATAVPEIAAFVCIQLFIFADVAMRTWVGPNASKDVLVVRLLILGIPSYMFFTTLRSPIDAAVVKAHNTANILIGLAVYLVLLGATVEILPAHWLLEDVAVSLSAALVVLGTLTARTVSRLYGASIAWKRSFPALIAAVALGGVSVVYRWLSGPVLRPAPVIVLEVCLSLVYLTILTMLGSDWIQYAWRTALRDLRG